MARKMKDSGIEWIGEIPEGWSIARGKHILTLLQRAVFPTDGVITCFRDGEVTLRSNRREDGFTVSLKEIGYQGIEPGDLVVHGMDGFAGSIGISDSRGKSSPVLVVLDSSQDKKYLMYYLRSMAYNNVFLALSTGIRVRSCDLKWNKLADLLYLVPPIVEQHKLVSFLDEKCSEMPEFGVLFKIDADYDTVEWYGNGPAETYWDRQHGAKLGIYQNKVADNMAQYLVPQECGAKTAVRWAKVVDRKGRGLLFTADAAKPMFFSALPYTPHEMESAKHPYELPPVHYTVIRAIGEQMGVGGDDSWGANVHPEYIPDVTKPVEFTFTFRGI